MLRFNDETIRTSLMPLKPRNKRINLNTRNTLKAGIIREIAVNQFFFIKSNLEGAKMNLITKSTIKFHRKWCLPDPTASRANGAYKIYLIT